MNEKELAVERIDQSEDAWGEADEVVEVSVKHPLDTVVPVRMAAETYEDLRREARARGIGPSTLIRMWILEQLARARQR